MRGPGMVTCPQKGGCRWGLAAGQLIIPEEETSSAVDRELKWPNVTAQGCRREGALSANIKLKLQDGEKMGKKTW